MHPLFTVHAGEFLVGRHIERNFRTLNVWIPSKDTGIDLLVTNERNSCSVSLQVKLSRDYNESEAISEFDRSLAAGGWFRLFHEKIANSKADYWVFVLVSYERKIRPRFIVIPPHKLLEQLEKIHGNSKSYHFYPWIMKSNDALDGRGLKKSDKAALSDGSFELGSRSLTTFLDNWTALKELQV